MLVRELIEQLSEMPPELPVMIATGDGWPVVTNCVTRGGRKDGPIALLHPDILSWQDYLSAYLSEHSDYAY